jgi:hypothetical protein
MRFRSGERQLGGENGAAARTRRRLAAATGPGDPFVDPGLAKVPLAAGLFGIVRREAPAVVPHFKAQYLRAEVNVDLDAAPVGVFDRIGYGLAPDSERRILQ